MKKTILIRAFFQKNKVAITIVSLLMLVSIFVMCWIQGFYDYCMRYVNTLEDYVGDRDLYMQFVNRPDEERTKYLIDEVSAMPGVEHVIYNIETYWTDGEGKFYKVSYLPKGTTEYIDFGSSIQEYAGGDTIECLAGYGFTDKGSLLGLSTYGDEKKIKNLNFKVNGVLDEDFMYLVFMTSGSGEAMSALGLLVPVRLLDENDRLMDGTEQNAHTCNLFVTGEAFPDFVGTEECLNMFNFYVKYKDGISDRERENARNFISQHGDFVEVSKIVENSKKAEMADIKRIIILPVLVLGVVTFACCAVILLIMQEKMQEYSVYYLCGCSKRKIIMLCFGSLSLMIVIPCLINLLIIIFNEKISDITGISFGWVIYSVRQVLFTIVYLLAVLLITGIIELAMIVKMSPVEMYRRMTR